MIVNKKVIIPGLHLLARGGIVLLFVFAVVLRVSLFQIVTSDYTFFLSRWYDFIQAHGGFAALKYNFSNYNVSYLYLLTLMTYLPIPKLIAIKSISAAFDGLLGLFVYLILRLQFNPTMIIKDQDQKCHPERSEGSRRSRIRSFATLRMTGMRMAGNVHYAAIIGVLVVLFAPTIVINSSAWGQADAIYAAFCLGSLYFLLKERPGWACIFFGIAISFKLQAIFFLPVLLMLAIKRKMPAKCLALVPLVFLLMLVPAFIAGRDAWSLLTIYAGQINGSGAGIVGQFNNGGIGTLTGGGQGGFIGRGNAAGGFTATTLTANAPSFYQWLPANAPDAWKWAGIALAALLIVVVALLLLCSKKPLTKDIVLKIALVFVLAIPFLLPEMHERYFYLADVISIIYAFYNPRRWLIPVVMQLCSLLSYMPYFINTQVVSLGLVAFGVLAIAIVAIVDLVLALFPGVQTRMTALFFSSGDDRPSMHNPEKSRDKIIREV